jgi:hypothetical protein
VKKKEREGAQWLNCVWVFCENFFCFVFGCGFLLLLFLLLEEVWECGVELGREMFCVWWVI